MQEINILYIDDQPERALEDYLDNHYKSEKFLINYSDIIFEPDKGYESLLNDPKVKSANIILVDSRLFENANVGIQKFSGEEFKFVLKKFFPYIEVIVITQNQVDAGVDAVKKYDPSCGKTAFEYYDGELPSYIEKASHNIMQYRILAEKMRSNSSWETVLKEKVLDTLRGSNTYDALTKLDIDTLINAFREIQEKIDD